MLEQLKAEYTSMQGYYDDLLLYLLKDIPQADYDLGKAQLQVTSDYLRILSARIARAQNDR
jgi:hypothetical protein